MIGSSASGGWAGGAPSLPGVLGSGGLSLGMFGAGAGLSGGGSSAFGAGGGEGGGGGGDGSARGCGGGGGGGEGSGSCGCGRFAIGPGGRAPGMNEKSSASEEEIQGTCSLRDARVTPTRVRFSVSSAIRSGTRISLRSSCTNRLWSPPLSETTDDSAA